MASGGVSRVANRAFCISTRPWLLLRGCRQGRYHGRSCRKARSKDAKMPDNVSAAAKSSVRLKNALVPVLFSLGKVVCRRSPRHVLMSWRRTERGNFLRALPIARPVPSPNCPLTSVCKLTSGTRPRDARPLASLASSPRTGRKNSTIRHPSGLYLLGRHAPGSVRSSR